MSSYTKQPASYAPSPPDHYPLSRLLAVDKIESGIETPSGNKYDRFQSKICPLIPGTTAGSYGGHVYGHAAYAASKTVKRGFMLHNVTGSFTMPGIKGIPFVFHVTHVRDGGTYCLRSVEVRQRDETCFSCLCSFKRPETRGNTFSHQPVCDYEEKYKLTLGGKKKEDHPLAPGTDSPAFAREVKLGIRPAVQFSGVQIRKVNMMKYNKSVGYSGHPERYRQIHFYRMMGLPGNDDEQGGAREHTESQLASELRKEDDNGAFDNLHICGHLFASDRNSLYLAAWALEKVDNINRIASLSHTVIIHTHDPAKFRMYDWDAAKEEDRAKWFTIEASTGRSGENRILHQGQIWTDDGTLLATTLQDGLLRENEPKL
ncbi:hypothetical protein FQN57_003938 [Myotisia sp. PD_48]|nr:hypothetical protein FQN57_003938 [Myotisia sp. PD_48]